MRVIKNTTILVLLGVLVLAAVAACIWWFFIKSSSVDTNNSSATVQTSICSQQHLDTAVRLISADNTTETELSAVAIGMQNSTGFNDSPDCLYVVSLYYAQAGNYAKALQLAERLAEVYTINSPYSAELYAVALQPAKHIEYIKFQEAQSTGPLDHSGIYYGPVAEGATL